MQVLMDIGVTVRVMLFAYVLTGDLRKYRLRYVVKGKVIPLQARCGPEGG